MGSSGPAIAGPEDVPGPAVPAPRAGVGGPRDHCGGPPMTTVGGPSGREPLNSPEALIRLSSARTDGPGTSWGRDRGPRTGVPATAGTHYPA